MYDDLQDHLRKKKNELHGDWVNKNSSYDQDICKILEMGWDSGRYYDAKWNVYNIEFKKGKDS